jgi:hypothetical protein
VLAMQMTILLRQGGGSANGSGSTLVLFRTEPLSRSDGIVRFLESSVVGGCTPSLPDVDTM